MKSLFKTALVLALLSLVGPFAIDMFLPALPTIATDLGVTEADAQITLSAYFIAFGLAQLIYGPWADQAGRKVPLYAGLGIFLLGSIGCALAPNLGWLAASRALQGLGAGAGGVVPRAIIRDRYTGPEATRLMSLVMLVISVSPMLAPLAGSFVIALGDWRDVFWSLSGLTLLSLIMLAMFQPETLAPEARVKANIGAMARAAGVLVRDKRFMGLTFVASFGFASFFVFIASASFVYAGQFGLTPTQFSLAFAANAIGFFLSSQFAAPIGARLGMVRMIQYGVTGFAAITVALLVVTVLAGAHLPVIIAMLFCANACLGVVIPACFVMSLDDHGDIAGTASSLGGALQMVTAAVLVAAMGPFFDGTALPMVGAIAGCGVVAFLLTRFTIR